MTSHWFFLANPRMFDIDGALDALSEIHWRVPQYTGAIAAGDGVVMWRSGPEAGIVGVGRVLTRSRRDGRWVDASRSAPSASARHPIGPIDWARAGGRCNDPVAGRRQDPAGRSSST